MAVYSFSDELRDKTKIAHDESDRLINLKVAAVLTDSRLWATAVAEFYYIFKAIEDSLSTLNEHPQVGVLSPIISEARRVPAFEKDLQFFFGSDWKLHLKPSEYVVKYCARINEVTDRNPVILIAYVHSMYLALLAGGQILQKIVKKTLGLHGHEGLDLFNFVSAERTELRQRIKSAVDCLELSRTEKDAIVEEKIRIFHMNNEIARHLPTSWNSYRKLFLLIVVVLAIPVICAILLWYFMIHN